MKVTCARRAVIIRLRVRLQIHVRCRGRVRRRISALVVDEQLDKGECVAGITNPGYAHFVSAPH
jgi:hypothetical protein